MNGRDDLKLKLRAGYCYFYVETTEVNKAVKELQTTNDAYQTVLWDASMGDGDPGGVVEMLENSEPNTVVIAKNFNWYLQDYAGDLNKEIVTFLQNNIPAFSSRAYRKALVIVSNESFDKAIPEALQKDFDLIDFSLPAQEEIEGILEVLCESTKESEANKAEKDKKFKEPSAEDKDLIVQEMKGLTTRGIENALAYAIIKHEGEFNLNTLAEIKSAEIERTAGLKLGKYTETFDDLKGYDKIKDFVRDTISSPLAKGLMLLGPPGTGKTMFGKAVSNECKMKMIVMEVAELFGGLVGESEKLMRTALEFIKANAPCILFVDEIEKALAGVGRSQEGDGGTTKRSMAQFLKFLSDDRPEGVYVIATCNDIQSLPPEWVRAERWDTAPFFIDLPSKEERDSILEHYLKVYGVKGAPPDMEGWSGAEIRSLCRIAKMMGKRIDEVTDFIIPVSETMGKEIGELRQWAKGKTLTSSEVRFPKAKGGLKRRRSVDLN